MSKELIELTTFSEQVSLREKNALFGGAGSDESHDHPELPMVIEFGEPEADLEVVPAGPVEFDEMAEVTDIESFLEGVMETSEEFEEVGDLAEEIKEMLPGLDGPMPEDSEEEERETDYVNDGDLSKFMEYVSGTYPAQIPRHDGTTMLGCEKAISFLDRLNSEISRAIRDDMDDVLDVSSLEQIRVSVMKDTLVLKDHLNKLKKKFKEMHKSSSVSIAEDNGVPVWKNADGDSVSYDELKKEAATPNKMVIAVPPFERAIAGILINAQVSGGNSMEDVWDVLSKKYDIQPREELAIMQVVMDMGFHVFKDRGTFSGGDGDEMETDAGGNPKNYGVEFLRNYFS